MLFNSVQFLCFFPLVSLAYFLLPHRLRWALLLTASCVFYMYFIPAYILILIFTILVDYIAGILIHGAQGSRRKFYLGLSIVANVGVLAVFKYINFANDNLALLAKFIGWNYPIHYLNIILPVGLSFHTFQAMSYTIEVYRGKQEPEYHLGIYALYVMFYPQLVAGPIERPQNLLHQFRTRHTFDPDRITSGLKLMVWGLFMKMVVADNISLLVNLVYGHPQNYTGGSLLVATYLFAIQIYCDFAGYSSIALGAAEVMGFRLMNNFDRPYIAASVPEFWRRWHISLSTWFRDYVYFPLGGSKVGPWRRALNIMVVFLLSGLWHGANWTFLVWGALHGLLYLLYSTTAAVRTRLGEVLGFNRFPRLLYVVQVAITFNLVCVAWVFFRAQSVQDARYIVRHMVRLAHFKQTVAPVVEACRHQPLIAYGCLAAILLFVIEALQSRLPAEPSWPRAVRTLRWAGYYFFVASILLFGSGGAAQFIYFQF